jgi:phage shock protein E
MGEDTRFQKLVSEAKKNVTEISPQDAAAKFKSGDAIIANVRDKDEWDEEHIPGAIHMSRGTIELDIKEKMPDTNALIICHCGGGGRSALAPGSLQKMGYKNVRSRQLQHPSSALNRRRLGNGRGRVSTWRALRPR